MQHRANSCTPKTNAVSSSIILFLCNNICIIISFLIILLLYVHVRQIHTHIHTHTGDRKSSHIIIRSIVRVKIKENKKYEEAPFLTGSPPVAQYYKNNINEYRYTRKHDRSGRGTIRTLRLVRGHVFTRFVCRRRRRHRRVCNRMLQQSLCAGDEDFRLSSAVSDFVRVRLAGRIESGGGGRSRVCLLDVGCSIFFLVFILSVHVRSL